MSSGGLSCCDISRNAYKICQLESNRFFPYWMCSAWGWVIKRPSQGTAAEMLPKTFEPTFSR